MKIAIYARKGGVNKTTATVNIAGILAQQGKRVLLIDSDAQGNVAGSFGLNTNKLEYTLYDVLLNNTPAKQAIINVADNIDLLPSNYDMDNFEFDLGRSNKFNNPNVVLKYRLGDLEKDYDYVLIDTPPALNTIVRNVLMYVDSILNPMLDEPYSVTGIVSLYREIEKIKEDNKRLEILGIFNVMVDSRTTLHKQLQEQLQSWADGNDVYVFKTHIPKSISFANATAYSALPATLQEPYKSNKAVKAYYTLTEEIKERINNG